SHFIADNELEQCHLQAKKVYENELLAYFYADDFERMALNRLDVAKNAMLCNHPYSQRSNLEVISMLCREHLKHCKTLQCKTSATFYNGSKAFVVYDKKAEMAQHGHENASDYYNAFLRIEAQFKARSLRARNREDRTLAQLDAVYDEYSRKLDECIIQLGLNQVFQSQEMVERKIKDCMKDKQAKNYIEFVRLLNLPAKESSYPNRAKELYAATRNPNGYNNRMSYLRQKGIFPFWADLIAEDLLMAIQNTYAKVMLKRTKRDRLLAAITSLILITETHKDFLLTHPNHREIHPAQHEKDAFCYSGVPP
ncbi:hypothetical protein LJC55_04530, partial [Eubacteriales bacterium OttesenSCG-928-N14]|nr:hypothetical protein [Eubacteriales bacterium OttesenSCG-928-N14]